MDYENFHQSLLYHLGKKGYGGQALICRHTDIPRSYLSRIVTGGRKAGARTRKKLARFFGYSLEEFVDLGRRITLGEDPDQAIDLLAEIPGETLIQRLTEAVRKEMKTARLLDRTQLLYESIVEHSRQMILRFDDRLNVTFANQACEGITATDPTGLIGRSVLTVIAPEHREHLRKQTAEFSSQGGSFSMELLGGRKDRWLYLTVSIFPGDTAGQDRGQLVGFDITDEVRNRKKLEELIDRLKFIQHGVEMSYVPTLWIGEKANIVYVNRAVCDLLGYTREELKKMHVWDINPLIPREEWHKKWTWFLSEESVVFAGQYRTKAGRIIPVEFQVSNLRYPDGRRYNVVFVKNMDKKSLPPTKK